eukprot:CAMPEP_0181231398 /NCGR_PEP_ID=MMETSP1096-20121128/35078_1 /TAXON_ID=156174 ORGANISM="Chrysochromulina ericina, Strain CCMP281" /NCGR_SAMPLE_ID=MMETSP1096 /ASSEMBLY_ACC=CAM_ASM_000453 /LENGTH=33 /DNA_ID= /DNA_START= /DNA_END= /DNA_ORIENTATION=
MQTLSGLTPAESAARVADQAEGPQLGRAQRVER